MPVKQRNPKAKLHRVTPEAVAAYRSGDWLGLHRSLGLKPWMPSPLDADTEAPPAQVGGMWRQGWPLARDLRRELEALVGQ